MAKQIIMLGIGAMDSLTPFITTGLEVAAVPIFHGNVNVIYSPFRDKRALVEGRDKRAVSPFRDKRAASD